MKRMLLALTILIGCSAASHMARADVSVDFFYNNLSGGSWIEVGDYGYCWQPDVAVGNNDWRPYADGYWAYTDEGWTWVSYEDFGWATYHYGRWARLADQGWVWVPGRDEDLEWGPAWVSWRTGGEYVGWAPLPPTTERIYEGRAITGQVDIEFDIGPAYYNFVDVRYIGEPVLRERIVSSSQNVTYINQTVNVTNITYNNRTVYNYGPDINVINQRSTRPIQRLTIQRENNVDFSAAAKSGGLKTRVQGQSLMVAAPAHITKPARQMAPPNVKTKVAKANVDRGWAAVGDAKAQEEFKQKLKTQDRSKIAPIAPAGANTGAQVGTSPAGATPASTAAQVGASPAVANPTASPAVNSNARTGQGIRKDQKLSGQPAEQATGAVKTASPSATAANTNPNAGFERAKGGGKHREPNALGAPGASPATTSKPESNVPSAINTPDVSGQGVGKPKGPHADKTLPVGARTMTPPTNTEGVPATQPLGNGAMKPNRHLENQVPGQPGGNVERAPIDRVPAANRPEGVKQERSVPAGQQAPGGPEAHGKKEKSAASPTPSPSP